LQGNEYEVGGIADSAALACLGVERELDRRADELADFAQSQPDAGEFAAILDVCIAERDSAFRCP
jgi:hypothetical protein